MKGKKEGDLGPRTGTRPPSFGESCKRPGERGGKREPFRDRIWYGEVQAPL